MDINPPSISPEEREQISQTIEMFELIVSANPQDCQSMEILKDAYQRIGSQDKALEIARKLADTYMGLGQYSSALLEYEGILQHDQDNLEVIAALGEVEERMHRAAAVPRAGQEAGTIDLDFKAVGELDLGDELAGLMATERTANTGGSSDSVSARAGEVIQSLGEDGNGALAKFVIAHQLADADVVMAALERVQKANAVWEPNTCASSLLDNLVSAGALNLEAAMCGILERSKFAYIPLDRYDVDRQIVKMLPESLTLGRLIIPFDVMSRTVMVAMANPFDAKGKEAVQQLLDYHVQWHLAPPSAIIKVLTETYRVQPPKTATF